MGTFNSRHQLGLLYFQTLPVRHSITIQAISKIQKFLLKWVPYTRRTYSTIIESPLWFIKQNLSDDSSSFRTKCSEQCERNPKNGGKMLKGEWKQQQIRDFPWNYTGWWMRFRSISGTVPSPKKKKAFEQETPPFKGKSPSEFEKETRYQEVLFH